MKPRRILFSERLGRVLTDHMTGRADKYGCVPECNPAPQCGSRCWSCVNLPKIPIRKSEDIPARCLADYSLAYWTVRKGCPGFKRCPKAKKPYMLTGISVRLADSQSPTQSMPIVVRFPDGVPRDATLTAKHTERARLFEALDKALSKLAEHLGVTYSYDTAAPGKRP